MHSFFWPITDMMTGLQILGGYVVGAIMVIDGTITARDVSGVCRHDHLDHRADARLRAYHRAGFDRAGLLRARDRHHPRQEREPLTEGLRELPQPLRGEVVFERCWFRLRRRTSRKAGATKCCTTSASASSRGSRLRCSDQPGRARLRWSICCRASTNIPAARITLDGIDIKDISREYLRAHIGIVEQEPFLFSRTIRENITYGVGREVSDAEVEAAARAADVHDVILSFPEGYKTIVGERGVTLSGGQKQRVAIARTLLKNPPILILDDSTSSVDTETEANIREALDHLMAQPHDLHHRPSHSERDERRLDPGAGQGRNHPARHA